MKKEINSNLTDNMIKSFKELNESVNINSIIGAPISVGNRYIIPISKLTVGYLGGGGEYGEIKLFAPDKSHPFAG
ncbi:MAG: hypothetical protein J6V66_05750, partial [Clostridia bacterium]|nr:hypothetical protein [Clostridia bacterium]